MYDTPFLGAFAVEEIDSAVDVDAIIVGVPFEDQVKMYPKGAAQAPTRIRKISQLFSGQGFQEKSIHFRNVLDFGDVEQLDSYQAMQNELAEKIQHILAKQAKPIILGGDHSIALGTAKGLKKVPQSIDGIVWIDAHLDLMHEYPETNNYSRATVLQRISELQLVSPSNISFIGCRGHNLGWEEVEKMTKKGSSNVLTAQEYLEHSKQTQFINNLLARYNNLYVSIDMDVLDPAFAPGVSVPEPGGLSSRELFRTINRLAPIISCLEIVEVNPTRDINNLTSMVACKIIFEYIDGLK
jgi:agmatinase